jgi:hypothetical protein
MAGFLPPRFLNLRIPVLLIDSRLLPDPVPLGLESFGSRNPRLPLPTTRIVVQQHPGAMISIWQHHPDYQSAALLGWHRAVAVCGDALHARWALFGMLLPRRS